MVLGVTPWHPRPRAVTFASYQAFASELAHWGSVESKVRTVAYDPEAWGATPKAEQKDPVTYFARFAALARRHGLQVMITPNPNLMSVPGGACVAGAGESDVAAYERCDVAGKAAAVADIVETQAQSLESDPAAYAAFVAATAAQARAANPQVKVIAGLSPLEGISDSQLQAIWTRVRATVDGFYLSAAWSRMDVVAKFISQLPAPSL